MTTQYNIDPNIQGVNGFGLRSCDLIFTATLAVATDTSLAVPASAALGVPASNQFNKWVAVMKYARSTPASPVFFANNATAAVPAGAAFAASTSEIEPEAKHVKTGDTLHFICAAAAHVSVAFYAVQD
jgi:hypothetical protein